MSHMTNEEIGLFLSGGLPAADLRRVLHHLVSGCPRCRARLKGSPTAIHDSSLDETSLYNGAVERAYEKALNEAPHCQREHRRLEALIALSHQARFRSPAEMLQLAVAAQAAAHNLDPRRVNPRLIADLQARAYAELGNAYRVNEDFAAAEDALAEADALVNDGTGDPLVLARLIDLKASLRGAQRRLPEAIELLDYLHQIYQSLDENHLAGRALISKGINVLYFGAPREAVSLLREGTAMLERSRDPQLERIALQSLIYALADCAEFSEARRLLLESGLRQKLATDPINLLRLRGIEAKIYAGLGKLWRAASILLEVRESLKERGLEYEAALVGLELLDVWLGQSRAAGSRELAAEVLATFERLGVETEALRAVRFLEEAVRREEASAALVQKVVYFLRRLEWEPRLQFAT